MKLGLRKLAKRDLVTIHFEGYQLSVSETNSSCRNPESRKGIFSPDAELMRQCFRYAISCNQW